MRARILGFIGGAALALWGGVSSAQAFDVAGQFEMRYLVELEGREAGVLRLLKEGDELTTKLYGITPDDNVPFYSQGKRVTFDSDEPMRLQYLEHESGEPQALRFHYNLEEVEKLLLQRAGLTAERDIERSTLIVDEREEAPHYTYNTQVPTADIDTLLLGQLAGSPAETFMLYIPAADQLYKLTLEKRGKVQVERNGQACQVREHALVQGGEGGDTLMQARVYNGRFPIELEAGSGRWSLRLLGIGRDEQYTEDIERRVIAAGKQNVRSQDPNVRPDPIEVYRSRRGKYLVDFELTRNYGQRSRNDESTERYLRTMLASGERGGLVKDGVKLRVTRDEACQALREQPGPWEYGPACKSRKKKAEKTFRPGKIRSSLEESLGAACYLREGSDDLENAFECGKNEDTREAIESIIRKSLGDDAKIKNMVYAEGKRETSISRIRVTYKATEKVPIRVIREGSLKALAQRFGVSDPSLSPAALRRKDGGYILSVSSRRINEHACSRLAENDFGVRGASYRAKSGRCLFDYTARTGLDDEGVRREIKDEYPDIDLMDRSVKFEGTTAKFRTIRSIVDDRHGCL